MAWWNRLFSAEDKEEKLNPAQPDIIDAQGGSEIYSYETPTLYTKYYETIEVVNRSVNMVVDDASEIPTSVGNPVPGLTPIVKGVRKTRVDLLLNSEPNPFQDISSFKRNCIIDLLLDGNIFIYFDGVALYHLPATNIVIHGDDKKYIKEFEFNNTIKFKPEEIVFVKENSFRSIYRGTSRLKAASASLRKLESMDKFQANFFKNGTVMGLVVTSPNTLSDRIKERMIQSWMTKYNPTGGGRRPLILDGGLDIKPLSNAKFSELDFETSIEANEYKVLKAIGVPPILLDSGNNANIRPNHRLYYLETVLPIVKKLNYAFERFFGYKITEDVTNIPALQPELSEQGQYFSSLVNTGVISVNEAREKLGYDPLEGSDDLRIPANITGSAGNPSEGGRPEENTND
jgi:HK97 family phage portal protein